MAINITEWKVEDYLQTEEERRLFLEAAFEEAGDDPAYIAQAIGAVARARGITELAQETGLASEALSASFSSEGNPSLTMLIKVAKALGFRLSLQPLSAV